MPAEISDPKYGRNEQHIDERSGNDAPEHGSWAGRRIYISDAAERAKHDAVGRTSHLSAGQSMAEFVQQNNEKESEILDDVPLDGGVPARALLDLVHGNDKPRPVEKDVDPGEAEQSHRALVGSWHCGRVIAQPRLLTA